MGFSWAMWAAQAAHEEVVARDQINIRMVRDRSDFVSLDDGPVSAVYVDSYACFALSQKEATADRDKVLRVAEDMGFICHELFEGSDLAIASEELQERGRSFSSRTADFGSSPCVSMAFSGEVDAQAIS